MIAMTVTLIGIIFLITLKQLLLLTSIAEPFKTILHVLILVLIVLWIIWQLRGSDELP
jgi:type III secretory pathway component EscU